MRGITRPGSAWAKRLFVISCLWILCVSQVLVPAARLHINLGPVLPASENAVLAGEQSRSGQMPCGPETRTCLNIKLAQIRIASVEPSQHGFSVLVFPNVAETRMVGLIPSVPTPPPRLA